MEQIFSIVMYILTGIGLLMTFSFWLSDIYLDGKHFRWYYYVPAGAVCILLGYLAQHVFVWWLYALSENAVLTVVLPAVYVLAGIGTIIGGFLLFRRKDDFSFPFYFTLSLFSLFVLSYWLCKVISG